MQGGYLKPRGATKRTYNIGGNGKSNPGYNKHQTMTVEEMIKRRQTGNAADDIEAIEQQFGGNIPVDTRYDSGNLSFNLNPKLDQDQTKAVASSDLYPQVKKEAIALIKSGVLNSKKGTLGLGIFPGVDRTIRQMSAEGKEPLMTSYDSTLQKLQSKMQKLKELMFSLGGTALTPTEEGVLGAPFILRGKSDQQILEDISYADALITKKAQLALGGANAGKSPIPGSPGYRSQNNQQDDPSDDPLGIFS